MKLKLYLKFRGISETGGPIATLENRISGLFSFKCRCPHQNRTFGCIPANSTYANFPSIAEITICRHFLFSPIIKSLKNQVKMFI